METPPPDWLGQREVAHELKAATAARRELGADLEDQVLEAFLARIQERVDARVSQTVGRQEWARPATAAATDQIQPRVIASSLALSIPLLAVAGGIAGGVGVVVVVLGLVAVSLLYFIDRWVRFNMR